MPEIDITPRLCLYYQDHNPLGTPATLLLHGLGATSDSWILQVPALTSAGFRVVTPDARGFGRSTYPGGPARIAAMSEDIARLLAHLDITTAHIVGISMGGVLAQQLALDHPGLVDRLVLANTFTSLRPRRLNVWLYFLLRFVLVHTLGLPTQARAVAQRIFPHPDQEQARQELIHQITQADPRGYRAAMRALALFNSLPHLHRITRPTLIITAEHDSTVPPETQARLVAGLPNARQVFISNSGHAVTIDQPETFNRIVLRFLIAPNPLEVEL